jgi:predicted RNA polymerase sigma factor
VRIVERMFAEAMEARGTDWAAIGALYATLHKGGAPKV